MLKNEGPSVDAGELKSCKVCAEPIRAAARVCINCGNYQDWRAGLNMGTAVLALFVAFASVLTAAVPALTVALTKKNSDLVFSLQSKNRARDLGGTLVSILATNRGIMPGTVSNPARIAAGKYNFEAYTMDGEVLTIIEPGKSKVITYVIRSIVGESLDFGDEKDCALEITATDFRGRPEPERFMLECAEIGRAHPKN